MDRKISKSPVQKITFASIHLLAILTSLFILFFDKQNFISSIFGQPKIESSVISRIIIFFCGFLYFVRHVFALFVLIKRKVEWNEVFIVAPMIILYQVLFAILTIYNKALFSSFDWIWIGLFVFGSYLSTWSELRRMIWKKDKSNKGKIYSQGLFKYSMHIDYLGDTILFTGFALLTGCIWALSVPVFITLGFVFFHIPDLDKYLEERYKEQFVEYKSKTKKFIPWIY